MKTYSVRVHDEDVEIEANSHDFTEDGWLKLSDDTGVIATFVTWSYFIIAV